MPRRRLARALISMLVLLAVCPAATRAGVNVFIGSMTIPSAALDANVGALPAAAAGYVPGPLVSGGSSGVANLWMEPGAGSCSRSSTPVDYASSSSPDRRCGTLQTAFTAASAGDVVLLKGGTYASGALGMTTGGSRSPRVLVQVAAGETVTLTGGIGSICNVNGITIDGTTGIGGENGHQGIVGTSGFAFGGSGCSNAQADQNITVKGVYLHDLNGGGAHIYGQNCDTLLLQDVTLDGGTGGADAMQFSVNGSSVPCNNVTFDRLNIYNYTCPGTDGDHQDFLQWLGGSNMVTRNSRWIGMTCHWAGTGPADNGAMGWFISCGFASCSNLTLENSVIANLNDDSSGDGAEIAVYNASGVKINNNTIVDTLSGGGVATLKTETSPDPPSNVTFTNNVFDGSCAGVNILFSRTGTGTYGNNVTKSNCGHTAQGDAQYTGTWNSQFTGPLPTTLATSNTGNWSLTSGAFAIGKANAASATITDLLGTTRDGSPDAGAYER